MNTSSSFIKNENGQTLASVLVSVGISGILALVLTTMSQNQTKSLQYFSQKNEAIQLQALINQAINNSSVCSASVVTIPATTLNTTQVPTTISAQQPYNGPVLSFSTIYQGSSRTTSPVLAQVGNSISPNSQLKVISIQYTDILSTGSPGQYTGNLLVSFDITKLPVALAPLKTTMVINVNTAPPYSAANAAIVSCGTTTGSSIGAGYHFFTTPPGGQLGMLSFSGAMSDTNIYASLPATWTATDITSLFSASTSGTPTALIVSIILDGSSKNGCNAIWANFSATNSTTPTLLYYSKGTGNNTSSNGGAQAIVPIVQVGSRYYIYMYNQQCNRADGASFAINGYISQ